jgi:hypothetical protein
MHIRKTTPRGAEHPKSHEWVAQGLSALRVTMWGTISLPQCINRSHIWQFAGGGLLKQGLFLCIFWQRGWEEMEATAKTPQNKMAMKSYTSSRCKVNPPVSPASSMHS